MFFTWLSIRQHARSQDRKNRRFSTGYSSIAMTGQVDQYTTENYGTRFCHFFSSWQRAFALLRSEKKCIGCASQGSLPEGRFFKDLNRGFCLPM